MGRRQPNKDAGQDISWRTRELGPELRRQLFEKLVPSGRPRAGEPDSPQKKNDPKKEPKPPAPTKRSSRNGDK